MQEISLLQAHMIAFAAGFGLDIIIGDPHRMPHPVRWIGNLIAALDRKLLGELADNDPESELRDRAAERRAGVRLVIYVVLATAVTTLAVMTAAYKLGIVPGIIVEAILTCYLLAMTSLRRESMKVYDELKKGSLAGARHAVSMIVGRDTEVLDEEGVTKAAVETVAENLSDGVIAPMLYAAIGGPVLGLIYKSINTMDSMVGYKNDRYMWFGAPAAHLDDAVNFIPARISAFLLIAASAVSGREYSAAGAYRIWKRDRFNHKSPNAAQTESAAAGALGVRLAGDAQYFGRIVHKPSIGDPVRPVEYEDIRRVNRLMIAAAVIGEALCLAVMYIISVTI
ncbi:MAG: cobalamin biosynthesis protein CobD [Mogibacterium sp.]|nr:cobalamin biosynthesis protein CobD [Mogibacterium sp.]